MKVAVDSDVNYRNFGFIPQGSPRHDIRGKCFGHPNLLKRLQARDIVEAMAISSSHTVLDFGCGAGFITVELAKLSHKTVGVDISPQVTKIQIPSTLKEKLEFRQTDEQPLPFDSGSFDRILASEVLMMVPDPNQFLAQMHTLLAADGRLVICNGGGHPAIANAYTKNSWILKSMGRLYPTRMPASYDEYCQTLNSAFQNRYDRFFSVEDIQALLQNSGFTVEKVVYSPGRSAGSYFSFSQFFLYLRTGRLLSQRNFALNYLFFSTIRRFEGQGYKGGIICVAKKQ